MKSVAIAFISAVILSGCAASGAKHATLSSVASFSEMETKIAQWGDAAMPNTLIVMDDDDTLTMMDCPVQSDPEQCQYIGGPAWYAWQSSILNDPTNPYRVAKTSDDLLGISALLLGMNNMPYTDPDIPKVLSDFTEKGARLLVLTARGNSNVSATESQFTNLAVAQKDFLSFVKDNALLGTQSRIASIAGPVIPAACPAHIPVTYQQGVMYVSGQNKGDMLKCLMAITNADNVRNIAFLDDTAANVQDVYKAFENSKNLNVLALHYTRLEAHKNALTQPAASSLPDNKYQMKANARWRALKSMMDQELLRPNLPASN
ncbi:DUF2608 domain-containing protein [Idiomarina abyssalis]|uniref:DUF2608 domain-containing protein n=1 Tax=Idiomarina abyssalis TaxID=86102 RepID=UPI003A92F5E1